MAVPLSCPETRPAAISILGVTVHDVTMDEAVAIIGEFAASGSFHHVVTVNPEFVMEARRNAAFAAVLNTADLAVPDGIGILWAARRRGHPLRERVAGVDLVERIAELAARQGLSIYFLGAAPGVAEAAARRLTLSFPGLITAGTYAGSPRPEHDQAILDRLAAARPDILLVAYGAPQQDLWIRRNRDRLGVAVAMGVGGALDFLSGKARRAPLWMRRMGLEWLHRLMRQPWRWRRMLALPAFAWAVLRYGEPPSAPSA